MTDEAREAAEWIVANVPNHTRGHFVARAYLRELAERREGGWQPIETAPKNHLPVLAWSLETGRVVAFRDVAWTWWPCPAHSPLSPSPTYWMPLPERPTPPTGKDRA